MAIVSASSETSLALGVFLGNILLYALTAWRFGEALFLYPAVWLSVVPYNLIVTTWFSIPMHWQGLAWLPLILVFILLGRFVFHKQALDMKSPREIIASLANPAMPFYLIAYALTVTMLLGSRWQPVSLTSAYAIVTLLYLSSTFLFRHPAWFYPTILTAHLMILSYYTIDPGDTPERMITIPFLGLTWIEALVGTIISRRYPVTEST